MEILMLIVKTRITFTFRKKILKSLALLSICFFMSSIPALKAQGKVKTVRVGWFNSKYCYFDSFGRRGGISYEYQQKIAAYTGWEYEYVNDSWPNLLKMLEAGEIDLLSDVSYTEERAKKMLFSSSEIGAESYYIYANINNRDITPDITSFNGKKIGVNKNSVQEVFLYEWIKRSNISPEILPITVTPRDAFVMLENGELDAYVTLDSYGTEKNRIPICKIGESDYYFSVNKNRPDLLQELNTAMNIILDEDAYFNQKMFEKHLNVTKTNAFLTPDMEKWLSEHGAIRVGYQDNYLPFCDFDKETKQFTGALKNYLAHAANCIRNAEIKFETKPYQNANVALNALINEEIDCVFPINLSLYDCETKRLLIIDNIIKTEIYIIMNSNNPNDIDTHERNMTVALNAEEWYVNYETFLKDKFPTWKIKYYSNSGKCLDAVAAGAVDCFMVSSYRINELENFRERYRLSMIPTGEIMPLSFAVKRNNQALYSILNKVANLTTPENVNAYISSNARFRTKINLLQFLRENWLTVIVFITALFSVILVLLLQKLKAERQANERQIQLMSARQMAFTDSLTGVKSKHAYVQAEEEIEGRINNGTVSKFSVGVFDLNDLKKVNDTKGHDAGDEYIREACRLISNCFKRSPVFRIGGDEFAVILEGEDYDKQDSLLSEFENKMEENLKLGLIVISSGISRFLPEKDKSFRAVFGRADAKMYRRKKMLKEMKCMNFN